MHNVDKIRLIEADELDSEFYFQTLLEQAYSKGLLTDSDIERLQFECINLLAYKTERYNSGDSSSIRVEKAQDIMTSNLFTISLCLKSYQNPDDAVTALQTVPIHELYKKGRKRINTMLLSAKAVHSRLMDQLVETPNVFYRSTLEGGIRGFFKLYYPDFSAHEIHITADYPAFNPMPKLAGIEFILTYLNFLYYENLFCSYFSANKVHHLLSGYIEDYQEHLLNIYEPLLLAALGCILVGTDIHSLNITDSGASFIYHLFTDKHRDGIAPLIENAADMLIRILDCPQGLARYIQGSLPMLIARIEIAARLQTLERVFVLPTLTKGQENNNSFDSPSITT